MAASLRDLRGMLRGVRRDLRRLRVWHYQTTPEGLLAWRWWEPPRAGDDRDLWDALVEREKGLTRELIDRGDAVW